MVSFKKGEIMKRFNEWLEQRKMNEVKGLFPLIGANQMGPLGYQIGRSLEKSMGGKSSASPPSSEIPYRYNKEEDDKKPWYQKDLLQYVPGTDAHATKRDAIAHNANMAKQKKDIEDLISKGWDPQDAKDYILHYSAKSNKQSPMLRYYREKYPNNFTQS